MLSQFCLKAFFKRRQNLITNQESKKMNFRMYELQNHLFLESILPFDIQKMESPNKNKLFYIVGLTLSALIYQRIILQRLYLCTVDF
jgi:hypothetical protein